MSDIRTAYTDYIRFRLKAENVPSLKMKEEPGGWKDDELELDRHSTYHGIFTKFSNKLEFYNNDKNYILNAYALGGINTDLRLTKDITKDVLIEDGSKEVKWIERYNAIADFNTMTVKDNILQIKFNSNNLAELIKSHESDIFEIERKDSIDEIILDPLILGKIDIEGRVIASAGEQKVDLTKFETVKPGELGVVGAKFQERLIPEFGSIACKTEIITQGSSQRHSAITLEVPFDEGDPTSGDVVEAMFFIDTNIEGTTIELDIEYNIVVHLRAKLPFAGGRTELDLVRYKWNGLDYDIISNEFLFIIDNINLLNWKVVHLNSVRSFSNVEYNEGFAFRWRKQSGSRSTFTRFFIHTIKINVVETFERSSGLSFMFTHDVYERLMYIITGEKNRFYSKFFGRIGIKDSNNNDIYVQDGLDDNGNLGGGLISMISGFWIRAFDSESEKYKSLKISLKDLIDSCNAVFNIGIGIETINFKERLRVEELKYFYRSETVIKLPFQVTKVKRKVISKMFYSGLTLGYNKGGDYENEIGLDEPNTKTESVTPIRKSKNKYKKISKIRADQYGMELIRIKPQILFPDEDTSEDEDNWFLDLIRDDFVEDNKYREAEHIDRLENSPTGIHHPDSFRSMIFTPLRILFRHGWILRVGMEPYLNKFIKPISSSANSTLTMKFIGEQERSESSDTKVSSLERSRFLPEEIEFEHPVDEDLIDLIFGTTKTLINGSFEEVPNFYFKFEWINENEEIERGYLKNLKPKGNGKFKMIKANENVI